MSMKLATILVAIIAMSYLLQFTSIVPSQLEWPVIVLMLTLLFVASALTVLEVDRGES